MSCPSLLLTMTAGIVIDGSLPPMLNTESWVLTMMAPVAPASCARLTLEAKLQLPRSIRAMRPAGKPWSDWHASAVFPVPSSTSSTWAVAETGGSGLKLAPPAV